MYTVYPWCMALIVQEFVHPIVSKVIPAAQPPMTPLALFPQIRVPEITKQQNYC